MNASPLSSASFTDPIPLTAELLAEHGGTLPDGSWVADGSEAWEVRDGRASLWLLDALAHAGGYRVVHVPEVSS